MPRRSDLATSVALWFLPCALRWQFAVSLPAQKRCSIPRWLLFSFSCSQAFAQEPAMSVELPASSNLHLRVML